MLLVKSQARPGVPSVEDMSLWDKANVLLELPHRFSVSLDDLASKPFEELAKELEFSVPQVMQLKLLQKICEDYYTIKQYRALSTADTGAIGNFYLNQWSDLEYEKMVVLFCKQGRIVEFAEWVGKLNETNYNTEMVVYTAKAAEAETVILVHNHPFGTVKPSPLDLRGTKHLITTGLRHGFTVTDHLIIGKRKYYSFVKSNQMDDLIETCKQEYQTMLDKERQRRMQSSGWD